MIQCFLGSYREVDECGYVKSVFAFWFFREYEQNRSSLRRNLRKEVKV